MLQDKQGFMWFGTDQGLCRFDGVNFKTYTISDGLTDNDVFFLKEDTKGRIWIICYNEIPCYIERNVIHKFSLSQYDKNLNTRNFPSDISSKTNGDITMLCSKIMLVFDSVLRIKEKYTFSSNVSAIAHIGSISIVEQQDSIFKIYNSKKSLLYAAKESEPLYQGLCIRNGRVYLQVRSSGINKIISIDLKDGGNVQTTFITSKQIFNFKFLSDSIIRLISNEMIEIVNLNNATKNISLFKNQSPSNVLIDQDNNTWISTLNAGVFMFPSNPVIVYSNAESKTKEALSICGDGKGRIVGGYHFSDVDVLDNGKFTAHLTYDKSIPPFRILSICRKADNFYLSSDFTLLKLDANLNFKTVRPVKELGHVKKIDFASDGSILIANSNSALKLFPDSGIGPNYFLKERATCVAEVSDQHYAVGSICGLYIYDRGKTYKFKGNETLSISRVSDIAVDSKGKVWIATNQNGLFCINRDTTVNIAIKDGLSSNLCKELYIDKADNVWICTNKGLNKLQQQPGKKNTITIYDVGYGLPTDDINDVYADGKSIWLATKKGIATFYDTNTETKDIPIRILSFYAHDSAYLHALPVSLTYRDNDIRIDFAGISFTGGRSIQYKYLLKKESSRSDTTYTVVSSIRFGALSPGAYTLFLWAANNNKVWSATPARVDFKIHPPFWQTWWFYALVTAFTVLTLWLLFRIRIMSVRKKEQEKNLSNKRISGLELQALRAQMNPHFIFNALNSIQAFYSNNNELAANKYMTTFSTLIRQILNSSSKNLITVKDEVTMLTNYIELEKMRYKEKFDYSIVVDDAIFAEKVYLPVMLIQPYVENAINHGLRFLENRQGLLTISFKLQNRCLVCTVDDNGVGFKTSQTRKAATNNQHISAAMRITRQRIDTLNTIYDNSIEITFADKSGVENTGVTVVVTLPIIDSNNSDV